MRMSKWSLGPYRYCGSGAGRRDGRGCRRKLSHFWRRRRTRLGVPAELLGWVRAGEALAALRRGDYAGAHERLDRARPQERGADPVLSATLAHFRGAVFCHENRPDEALLPLRHALELFGADHFVTGQVLDTFGTAYAAKDDLPSAREFYGRAAVCKKKCGDEAGLALTYGQLGRLALDWGDLRQAEKHFRDDLTIVCRLGQDRAAAQMHNHLGQVALAAGRVDDAIKSLDESIRRSEGRWPVTEAYARKDRAPAAAGRSRSGEATRSG